MKLTNDKKILIIGLGLMGGSYAIALKKKGYNIGGVTLDQSSIDFALEKGIIDYGATEVTEEMVSGADIVIFALYPHIFVEWIEKKGHWLKPGTVITDVTGVKSSIVYKIQSMLPEGVEFISAHPMTGREVYGVENSTDKSFSEANYIVTPTEKNTREAIELAKDLGHEMGFARVRELTPEAHDEVIAFVSQLAHCIAITLMTCNDLENLEDYTGNSFRDLTRIAHINENMWSELFMLNKDALLKEMDLFSDQFEKLRVSLKDGDLETMKDIMRKSTVRRDAFDKK